MANKIKPSVDLGSLSKSAVVLYRLEMRPYNFKEICRLYGMKDRAMRNALKPFRKKIGDVQGYYYTIIQVEKIIKHIGLPYVIQETANPSS